MTPRERGAAAIWAAEHDMPCDWAKVKPADQEMYLRMFKAAVAAYTLSAAEQGWHMRPDVAVPSMIMEPCQRNEKWRLNMSVGDIYRAILDRAPEFKVEE